MTGKEPIVFVVDDDLAVRNSLCWLISAMKLPVVSFSSARAFLDAVQPDQPGCVLVDLVMPEMTGHELQEELKARSIELPVIVMTGQGTQAIAERAMAAGALGYIEKPINDEQILELVRQGIKISVEKLS